MTYSDDRVWTVYLSGEIHTDWRKKIAKGCKEADLSIDLVSPVLDHAESDGIGERVLGKQPTEFYRDHTGAKINAIRNKALMESSDIVVVRFGDKYRQWNAAFDAGQAVANDKPLIVLHDAELTHALKEIDAAALAVCETPEQVCDILEYVIDGDLA